MTIWSRRLSLYSVLREPCPSILLKFHAQVHQKAFRHLPAGVAEHESKQGHFADLWSLEAAMSAEVDARGGELPASGSILAVYLYEFI